MESETVTSSANGMSRLQAPRWRCTRVMEKSLRATPNQALTGLQEGLGTVC